MRSLGAIVLSAGVLGLASPAGARSPPARARVFATNPVRTPEATVEVLALSPAGDRLAHRWLRALSCPPAAAPKGTAPCVPRALARPDPVAGDVYDFPPEHPAFAEASLFHHAGRTMSFFRQLGLDPPWPRARAPLRLVANVATAPGAARGGAGGVAAPPWSDALFVRGRGATGDTIWFGRGAVANPAHDGDVVAHEVTHALLEPLLPRRRWLLDEHGAHGDAQAMDEALADYFAAALTGDPLVGEHAVRNAPAELSRNLAAPARCPESLTGRRHADALVLASALWAIRASSPVPEAARLDRALLSALRTPGGSASVQALVQGTLDQLATAPALAARARQLLGDRGLHPRCQRILSLGPEQSLSGTSGTFVAPGRITTGARGLSPGLLQFRLRPPPGTGTVRLRFRTDPALGAASLRVLAKAGGPVRWQHRAHPPHDGRVAAMVPGEGPLRAALIPVAGAAEIFFQLASTAAADSWFDDLAVVFERGN